jgi:hypothetical protein
MKTLLSLFALAILFVASAPALAATPFTNPHMLLRSMGGSIPVPTEWDGLWTTTDSTYECTGELTDTSAGVDTICAGQIFSFDSGDPTIQFDCTGSADATTYTFDCTASGEVFPGCTFVQEFHVEATRTGDTFYSEAVMTITLTGAECAMVICDRFVSHGVRTGPAPTEYCATPARPSTWGQLKTRYR